VKPALKLAKQAQDLAQPTSWPADEVEKRPLSSLIPYARNARTHSDSQVAQLAGSMKQWGWTNPVLIDEGGQIIAGHGRVMAAQRLVEAGHEEFSTARVMVARGWTDSQKRSYVLADNQLALNAGWDDELLKLELADLEGLGVDLDSLGFTDDVLDSLGLDDDSTALDPHYTRKIEAPIYQPTGEKPPISALVDDSKTQALVADIRAAGLPQDLATFLEQAAHRHTAFNFAQIAEFYAHAEPEVQRLMEASALVIIDFDQAIEHGFVKLTKRLGEMVGEQEGADDDSP
jgi:hypothetical protein